MSPEPLARQSAGKGPCRPHRLRPRPDKVAPVLRNQSSDKAVRAWATNSINRPAKRFWMRALRRLSCRQADMIRRICVISIGSSIGSLDTIPRSAHQITRHQTYPDPAVLGTGTGVSTSFCLPRFAGRPMKIPRWSIPVMGYPGDSVFLPDVNRATLFGNAETPFCLLCWRLAVGVLEVSRYALRDERGGRESAVRMFGRCSVEAFSEQDSLANWQVRQETPLDVRARSLYGRRAPILRFNGKGMRPR